MGLKNSLKLKYKSRETIRGKPIKEIKTKVDNGTEHRIDVSRTQQKTNIIKLEYRNK